MRSRIIRWTAGLCAVAIAFAGGWLLTGGGTAHSGPPRPPYVNSHGQVVPSLLPDMIPVSDSHGNVAGYIKSSDAFAAPRGPFASSLPAIVYDAKGQPAGFWNGRFIRR